jgi:putative ABC transport system permease protein
MMARLVARSLYRSPRRLAVGLLGVAVPVALFSATAFFIDTSSRSMTAHALLPVQVDMQVLARTVTTDIGAVDTRLAMVPHVRRVEPFAVVDLAATIPGSNLGPTVRVFAVRPDYLSNHNWVHLTSGSIAGGVALADPIAGPGARNPGTAITFSVPGGAPIVLRVTGSVDLRKADTWFATTSGDNQGDIHFVPASVVVDYTVFAQKLLPVLQAAALQGAAGNPAAATTSGTPATTAPAAGTVSLQAHVTFDRSLFASDPGVALTRSTGLRRTLERAAPGQVTALDNLGDSLGAARTGAIDAKVLFLFLGLPGVLVAAGLALATAAALVAAQRRETALLRLRGATSQQIARMATATSATVGLLGSAAGLGLGALLVTVLLGSATWTGVGVASLTVSATLSLLVGLAVTTVSLRSGSRAARRGSVATHRRVLDLTWRPAWKRLRLDMWAIGAGLAILAINLASGGFRNTPNEGQTLSLSFYLLLAPLSLWVGVTLLGVRLAAVALGRATRPDRSRPLTTWAGAAMRWLGRRPARTAATVIIGTLAVAFGTNLISFIRTYNTAKRAEAAITVGADVRVTPAQVTPPPAPPLTGPDVAATTPIRVVTLTTGVDGRTAFAVDPVSYAATVVGGPVMSGTTRARALAALGTDRSGVLVSSTYSRDFNVLVGDVVHVTAADTAGKPRTITLRADGIFTSAAPATPGADLIVNASALGSVGLAPPDFYLVRAGSGHSPASVAARIRAAARPSAEWTVVTVTDAVAKEQSTLATLNLRGLGRIETTGTIVIATLAMAVLGAFLVLERRREYAVMRSLGATTAQIVTPAAVEGAVTVAVSIALGVPIGVGMTVISTRVLKPLFTLSPPLISFAAADTAGLVALVIAASAATIAVTLGVVARLRTVAVLRET